MHGSDYDDDDSHNGSDTMDCESECEKTSERWQVSTKNLREKTLCIRMVPASHMGINQDEEKPSARADSSQPYDDAELGFAKQLLWTEAPEDNDDGQSSDHVDEKKGDEDSMNRTVTSIRYVIGAAPCPRSHDDISRMEDGRDRTGGVCIEAHPPTPPFRPTVIDSHLTVLLRHLIL